MWPKGQGSTALRNFGKTFWTIRAKQEEEKNEQKTKNRHVKFLLTRLAGEWKNKLRESSLSLSSDNKAVAKGEKKVHIVSNQVTSFF